MKPYNFIKELQLDAREKISLKAQLRKKISQDIIGREIPLYGLLPDPLIIQEALDISLAEVQWVYDSLVQKKMIKYVKGEYSVAYKEFMYDVNEDFRSILEALEINGFTAVLKKYPARKIPADKVEQIHPWFAGEAGLYELPVDYYGDDVLFGVTRHYLPERLSDDLDAFMETHEKLTELYIPYVSQLEQNYTEHAIIFPDWVSDAFNITRGQAGTMIKVEYYSDDTLYLYYEAYITNQYTLVMTHGKKAQKPTQSPE